ncbi:hypothetical protein [Peribacillus muralis]|uniref:hypothetical protein n=1 Tax=Peribacillus muralis TaxID=264697 RepID=UPI0012E9B3DE|nr:hypothetical protein [Peribacillus muralis]
MAGIDMGLDVKNIKDTVSLVATLEKGANAPYDKRIGLKELRVWEKLWYHQVIRQV